MVLLWQQALSWDLALLPSVFCQYRLVFSSIFPRWKWMLQRLIASYQLLVMHSTAWPTPSTDLGGFPLLDGAGLSKIVADPWLFFRIPTPAGTPFASAVPRSMSSVTCFEPSFIFDSCDFDAIPEDVEADLIGETPTASEGEDDDLPSRGNHLKLPSFILILLFPHLHLA